MRLIPAIDLRHGRCVRLLKGDFDQETRYEVDPVALARDYAEAGADWLHIVDLDGAASGRPVNLELISAMKAASGLHVQMGGGVRSRTDLDAALLTADRIVIGSLAVSEPERVGGWLEQFGPERFTLGFDVRIAAGVPYLTTHGWTRTSDVSLADAIARFRESGLVHVLCTDVDKDGAMTGPNFELYADCARTWPDLKFQASGGIRDAHDLARLQEGGAAAAISGKALLEGRLSKEEMRPFLPNA
jgi:phosphoribosylformimino-5-aminoimidazole carboxamide ribotide isomerase